MIHNIFTLCLIDTVCRWHQRQREHFAAVQLWRPQQLSTAGKVRRHSQAGVRTGQGGEEVTERAG